MWSALNAANTILKSDKLFEEFHAASMRLRWFNFSPPAGGYSAQEINRNLVNFVKAQGSSPFNLEDEIGGIIKEFGTPAIIVQGDKPQTSSQHWSNLCTAELLLTIPAVGRLRKLYTNNVFMGSAWFIEKNIAVTAGHVAWEFSKKSNTSYEFPINDQGQPTGAEMDTRAELGATGATVFKVQRVIYIHSELDVAFLEMAGDGPTPNPIQLDENLPSANEDAAVIGHPRRFEGYTNAALAKKMFGDIFEVKRVLIGKIMSPLEGFVTHSCPTLGGCSGAPLVSIETGKALGLHVGGAYNKANRAVPSKEISRLLEIVKKM
jgi:endonuclease G, mitochondrial